jgi:hypothetical protein
MLQLGLRDGPGERSPSFERYVCMIVSRTRFPVAGLNSVLKVYRGAIESSFEYNKCALGTKLGNERTYE